MNSFNIVLAIASLVIWAALYIVFYQDKIRPWLANRLTRDKPLKKGKIENGYFPDGSPIPFRENLFPSANGDTEEKPTTTHTSPPNEDTHQRTKQDN